MAGQHTRRFAGSFNLLTIADGLSVEGNRDRPDQRLIFPARSPGGLTPGWPAPDCPAMAPILLSALLMLGSAQAAPDPPSAPSRRCSPPRRRARRTPAVCGDGTSYTVLSSQSRRDQAARCGFDPHGAPIDGVYLVELRHYETWRNGVFIRTWEETAKTFQQCVGH